MQDCVFCQTVRGEAEAVRIWEDDRFLAILDGNPNTKGQTLVLPKAHYHSYAFDMPGDAYQALMGAAKTVAHLLDRKLKVQRTAMVMEGLGVDHVHIKLYPLHGLDRKFRVILASDKVWFDTYRGYVTTQMGPRADRKVLEELGRRIREP